MPWSRLRLPWPPVFRLLRYCSQQQSRALPLLGAWGLRQANPCPPCPPASCQLLMDAPRGPRNWGRERGLAATCRCLLLASPSDGPSPSSTRGSHFPALPALPEITWPPPPIGPDKPAPAGHTSFAASRGLLQGSRSQWPPLLHLLSQAPRLPAAFRGYYLLMPPGSVSAFKSL